MAQQLIDCLVCVQISSADGGGGDFATYVLKIINPKNKGGEVLVNDIDMKEVFTSKTGKDYHRYRIVRHV